MASADLENLEGLEWLVAARNEIQILMWQLHTRWTKLDPSDHRELAAGAAFSLWRACFLLAKKENLVRAETGNPPVKPGRVGRAAKDFISKIVETNAIAFGDEMAQAAWTAGYYVNNAVYRVGDMQGQPQSHTGNSIQELRLGWNRAFRVVQYYVREGTLPGIPEGGHRKRPQHPRATK